MRAKHPRMSPSFKYELLKKDLETGKRYYIIATSNHSSRRQQSLPYQRAPSSPPHVPLSPASLTSNSSPGLAPSSPQNTPQFRIGFITPPWKDSQIPVKDHRTCFRYLLSRSDFETHNTLFSFLVGDLLPANSTLSLSPFSLFYLPYCSDCYFGVACAFFFLSRMG